MQLNVITKSENSAKILIKISSKKFFFKNYTFKNVFMCRKNGRKKNKNKCKKRGD